MAFHPYPRVIPPVFNLGGFGPPRGLTPASACPWVAHPASRLRRATASPASDSLSLRLAWRLNLAARRNSLAHSTKGTPSPARAGSDCLWAHGFRCCFTPLPGCFSPFPHGTGPLSVTGECLGLEGGPPCFPPGFTCPAVLGVRCAQSGGLRLRGSNPVPPAFPCRSAALPICHCAPGRQPRAERPHDPGGANPAGHARSPVWPVPRSLAATGGISVDFSSSAYLDVSVRRVVPRRPMGSAGGRQASLPAGFAHSETRGSKAMCASPRLIAACHVLLRLPVPRHPPCAFPILPAPSEGGGVA